METGGKIRAFLRYYRPHKGLFLLDMTAAITQAALTVLIPYLVYQLFDRLNSLKLTVIVQGVVLLAVLALAIAAAEYTSLKWGHILGVRMEADMRRDLFAHLQKLSFSYFDRTKTGHIMSRISNDLTQIAETAHHAPEDLIISVLTMGGAFAVMFHLNWQLAAITLIPLPFIVMWGNIFQKRMHQGFRTVREKVAEINSRVENSIQGIREVKSYNNEDEEIRRFRTVNDDYRIARQNVFATLAWFHSGISFLIQGYSLLFIGAGAVLMYYGKANLAEVLAFSMYSRFITMPIFRMVNFTEQYQQGISAFERFLEVMHETPELVDPPHPVDLPELRGEISLRNVSFRYPAGDEEVLHTVSLEIPAGGTVALVGESGAGKSTLASLIPRFYDVTSGEIAIDGVDVRAMRQTFLHTRIGIVQQSAFLFDTTIRDNILFGRPEATEEEMTEAARQANILDFIETLPDRFDTAVGENGVRLSGGQRQRLAIARVFLKNPAILILDEATSSLDNQSEALVQEALERLCRNRTTIIIAHRLSTVRHAARIVCLRGGRVVEAGSHADLLAADGYYAKLYTMHRF